MSAAKTSAYPAGSPQAKHTPESSSGDVNSNQPPSPSSSISGCELSYASSDTECESITDSLATPPTSPHRPQTCFSSALSTSSPSSEHFENNKTPSSMFLPKAAPIGALFTRLQLSEAFEASPTASTSSTQPVPVSTPPRPSIRLPPSSLSARRQRAAPGTIDMSTLPQFPAHPSLSVPPCSGNLTPHASSENSGSTPRANPDRPGLFSRWSTDSEESLSDAESTCSSSLEHRDLHEDEDSGHGMSEECEEDDDAAEHADGESGNTQSEARLPRIRKVRSYRNTSSGTSSPFLVPASFGLSSENLAPIPSPVSFNSPSLFPPAPKPHQSGFSPYASPGGERSGFNFDIHGGIATPSSPLPTMRLSPASPTAALCRQSRSHDKPGHKLQRRKNQQDFDDGASDDSGDSPNIESLPPAQPAGRLTRSQGLRIRDQGDKPRGRYARSLSLSLQQASCGISSPMKTANALLDGTISPAETTQDPLRVKLREMPGAKTPDVSGLPSASPSLSRRPSTKRTHSSPTMRHLCAESPSSVRASSPLHISSLPGEASRATDTTTNLFNNAFSFANRESPRASPLLMRSPGERMPAITESSREPDSNPYFAGYA